MRKLLMLASMLAFALLIASPALAVVTDDPEEAIGICHVPQGNPANVHFIPDDDSSFDMHLANHEGDFLVTEESDCVGEEPGEEPGDNENNNNNENNNTNVNVNENNNTNVQSQFQAQSQSQSVVINLTNINQNANFVIIGGKKVEDFNKDGVVTVHECKEAGVSKTAAVTFAKKVVTADTVVKGTTVVTKDVTVVSPDVVTSDTTTTTAVLPETGGASLLALGAGALLVAGGLLARRIVR